VKNLIFIEGVSGVGKTTMARNVFNKLRDMGFAVECFLEPDFKNPIDFHKTAYFKQDEYVNLLLTFNDFRKDIEYYTTIADDVRLVSYYNDKTPLFAEPLLSVFIEHEFCYHPVNPVSLSEYTRVYKIIWENFARNVNTSLDYIIFDCSLISHPINDLIRNYNVSQNQAIYHVNTLIETIKSLNPRIVYLSSDNVAERLCDARISRNQKPPTKKQIDF